jgi:hypothetical protein
MVSTKMGFYHDERCYPMTTPLEFLRFPPLNMIDRMRLAYTIWPAARSKTGAPWSRSRSRSGCGN